MYQHQPESLPLLPQHQHMHRLINQPSPPLSPPPFPESKNTALQNTVVVQSKGKDKVYVNEDSLNPEEESQWPSEVPSA
ncbi:rCG35476 [Rattus norvegicus]|uniref:RCG35476 n=1 Tax=Rattus norvegicus TaxID=10116 RepID=A6HDS6_RAT|nr:rCG35476 [Rattus norvegicus]